MIYSGVNKDRHAAAGVGCIIRKELSKQIVNWQPISERILRVEMENIYEDKTNIIVVYAPNEDDTTDNKDNFWEELTTTTENYHNNIIVLGDFNSRVGRKDNTTTDVIGKYGEEKRNNNGKRMLQYCTLNNLIITNTFYQHRDIHKYTREIKQRNEKSIIDYILVQRNNRRSARDVRVYRSNEINSDHYLLIAKIKGKTRNRRQEQQERTNLTKNESIRTYKLRKTEIVEKYIERINREAEQAEGNMDSKNVEETWQIFKEILLNAARQTCGTIKLNYCKKTNSMVEQRHKRRN